MIGVGNLVGSMVDDYIHNDLRNYISSAVEDDIWNGAINTCWNLVTTEVEDEVWGEASWESQNDVSK